MAAPAQACGRLARTRARCRFLPLPALPFWWPSGRGGSRVAGGGVGAHPWARSHLQRPHGGGLHDVRGLGYGGAEGASPAVHAAAVRAAVVRAAKMISIVGAEEELEQALEVERALFAAVWD